MAHAEKCPVCYGEGKVSEGPGALGEKKTCHGCGGTGWVTVQDPSHYPITHEKEPKKVRL